MSILYGLLRKNWLLVTGALGLLLLGNGITLLWNTYISEIVNCIGERQPITEQVFGMAVLCILLTSSCSYLGGIVSGWTCETLNHDLRMGFTNHLFIKPFQEMESLSVGGQMSILQNEIAEISTIAGKAVDWSDSADLQSALNYQAGNAGYNALTESFLASLTGGQVQFVDSRWNTPGIVVTVSQNVNADMGANVVANNSSSAYNAVTALNPDNNNYTVDDYNTVLLFVVDNGVDLNNAMDQIAGSITRAVQDLDDDYNAEAGRPAENNMYTANVDYEYTGSVATCTKTFESGHGVGVSFIAVEIVRHIA